MNNSHIFYKIPGNDYYQLNLCKSDTYMSNNEMSKLIIIMKSKSRVIMIWFYDFSYFLMHFFVDCLNFTEKYIIWYYSNNFKWISCGDSKNIYDSIRFYTFSLNIIAVDVLYWCRLLAYCIWFLDSFFLYWK